MTKPTLRLPFSNLCSHYLGQYLRKCPEATNFITEKGLPLFKDLHITKFTDSVYFCIDSTLNCSLQPLITFSHPYLLGTSMKLDLPPRTYTVFLLWKPIIGNSISDVRVYPLDWHWQPPKQTTTLHKFNERRTTRPAHQEISSRKKMAFRTSGGRFFFQRILT